MNYRYLTTVGISRTDLFRLWSINKSIVNIDSFNRRSIQFNVLKANQSIINSRYLTTVVNNRRQV